MTIPPNHLNADLYQLTGEEAAQEHIAGSGALSVAGLYANHGSVAANTGFTTEAEVGLNQTAMAYRTPLTERNMNAPLAENYYSSLIEAMQTSIEQNAAAGTVPTETSEQAESLFSLPESGLGAAALGQLGTLLGGSGNNGTNGSNGNNGGGSNGNDGQDGQDGNDATCDPKEPVDCTPSDHYHGGDTHITIIDIDTVIHSVTNAVNTRVHHTHSGGDWIVNNTVNNATNIVTHTTNHLHGSDSITNNIINNISNLVSHSVNHAAGTTLIDIDLGSSHHGIGNDPNLLDLNLGGAHHVIGHDNDLIDLSLGGSGHVGGNDNDLIDLGLSNDNHVAGNDNDLIDLGLGDSGHVGGNDNDLIDLRLFDHGTTTGTDNDLIDLSLNDHGTAGADHDAVDLDLSLLDDGGLAGVDLGSGNLEVIDLSLNGTNDSSDALFDLHADTGSLLGQGCEGLLSDDLSVDLSMNEATGDVLGHADGALNDALGLPVDTSHLAGSSGAVLGLQLGLGAWI